MSGEQMRLKKATYHYVKGTPFDGRIPTRGHRGDDKSDADDADDTADANAQDKAAGAVACARCEAPHCREILAGGNDGEDEAVEGEYEVVEGDSRNMPVVARSVLFSNDGGIVEHGVGHEVRGEAWSNCGLVSALVSTKVKTDIKLAYPDN